MMLCDATKAKHQNILIQKVCAHVYILLVLLGLDSSTQIIIDFVFSFLSNWKIMIIIIKCPLANKSFVTTEQEAQLVLIQTAISQM